MIYVRGNAAKQWILTELAKRQNENPKILDLGCGTAKVWQTFLETHQTFYVVGVDTDARAIAEGQRTYAAQSRIELSVHDAQRPLAEGAFDIVVALSAIEHVVDRPAFLQTVWRALKNGGVAYLNYDDGHFRSRNVKERLMVPISQVLALVGIEGSYMKHVDDVAFREQVKRVGFEIVELRKHNLSSLKGIMSRASDEAVTAWISFEDSLNRLMPIESLDKALWSSTLVVKKP